MKRTRGEVARTTGIERVWIVALTGTIVMTALILTSFSAFAVSQRVKTACKSDYYRHCPAYVVGSPQLRTCMTKAGKRKQLSRRCLRALIDSGEVPRKYLRYL